MLLFFAAAVFVAVGLISRPLLSGVKQASVRLVQTGDVDTFIDNVDTASKNLSYKGKLIDLYSLWYRATDTREVAHFICYLRPKATSREVARAIFHI